MYSLSGMIIGTKDYRKPEWVTHMEELQSQLKGKERTLSLDSLEHVVVRHPCESEEEDYDEGSQEIPLAGSFYLLPPIEEFSEPSTSGSSRSDRPVERQLASSCQDLSTGSHFDVGMRSRCQTFPLTCEEVQESRALARAHTMYPEEPRELDPDSFHQLHTADSSEELQEFLLLESQCMTVDTGLAHAFLSSGNSLLTTGNYWKSFLDNKNFRQGVQKVP